MRYFIVYGWSDCCFCISSQELLEEKGEHYMMIWLGHDDGLLEHFKNVYEWETVPLVLVADTNKLSDTTLVGGYTDLIQYLEG